MSTLEVRAHSVGPWPMNTYVLVCGETKISLLIDPGADPEILEQMLDGTQPMAIFLTHTHPDHVGALAEMQRRLNVPLLAHPGPHFQGLDLGTTTSIAHCQTLQLGAQQLLAQYAPGHIDDMICLHSAQAGVAIVGDTMFAGGPGKTRSAEAFRTTLNTLRDVVLPWPDETICYAGHGRSFRLGDLRSQVVAFIARDHGDFYGDATWE